MLTISLSLYKREIRESSSYFKIEIYLILDNFNYIDHYKKDAVEFDYFEERKGATAHDERRVREYIISKIPKSVNSILDVGCGKGWVAKEFLPERKTSLFTRYFGI